MSIRWALKHGTSDTHLERKFIYAYMQREFRLNPDEVNKMFPEDIMIYQMFSEHSKENETKRLAYELSKIFGGKK